MASSHLPAALSHERIPREIQSDIVDAISMDHPILPQPECKELRETLRTCLFVSPAFRWSARRHLFEKIELICDSRLEFYNRLLHLRELIDVPDLGILSCIRHFDFNPEDILCNSECQAHRVHCVAPFVRQSVIRNLSFVLDMLCHPDARLDTLIYHGPGNCGLSSMPPEFQRSLHNAINSSHLTSLKLYHVRGIPKNILRGTSITQLTLIESTIYEYGNDRYSHAPLPPLELIETDNLSLITTLYPVDQELSDEEGPSLNEVRLEIRDEKVGALTMLDIACATFTEQFPSVENLDLLFRPQDMWRFLLTRPKIDLTRHSALQTLTLYYGDDPLLRAPTSDVRSAFYTNHIRSIVQACPDSLQYLTLVLGHAVTTPEDVLSPNPLPWVGLDTLLAHKTFPCLEGVDIRLRCQFLDGYSVRDKDAFKRRAEKAFERVLPTASSCGMLNVWIIE